MRVLYHASFRVADISIADGFVDEETVIGPSEVADGNAVPENGLQSKHGHFSVGERRGLSVTCKKLCVGPVFLTSVDKLKFTAQTRTAAGRQNYKLHFKVQLLVDVTVLLTRRW